MYSVAITGCFDSAHHLVGYQGPCAQTHGHSFSCEITIEGGSLDSRGILIDFKVVKDILKREVIEIFDQHDLNEIEPFSKGWQDNPTAENIARYIYEKIRDIKGLRKVRVYESPDCFSEYWE